MIQLDSKDPDMKKKVPRIIKKLTSEETHMLENIRKLILKKLQLVLLWGKLRQYYIQKKNSYFKKHARKGKNTRVRDFGNEKKKNLGH